MGETTFLSIYFLMYYTTKITPLCVSHQPPGVGVYAVGGVDELQAGFGFQGELLVVVEPAVLRSGEALVLQASQLGGGSNRDGLWHAAPRHHRFDCAQTDSTWTLKAFLSLKLSRGTFNLLDRVGEFAPLVASCFNGPFQPWVVQFSTGCVTFSF